MPKLQAALSEALGGRWVQGSGLNTGARVGAASRAWQCGAGSVVLVYCHMDERHCRLLFANKQSSVVCTDVCCCCRHLDRHLDADEAVVLGAGLFAANLSSSFRLRVSQHALQQPASHASLVLHACT